MDNLNEQQLAKAQADFSKAMRVFLPVFEARLRQAIDLLYACRPQIEELARSIKAGAK